MGLPPRRGRRSLTPAVRRARFTALVTWAVVCTVVAGLAIAMPVSASTRTAAAQPSGATLPSLAGATPLVPTLSLAPPAASTVAATAAVQSTSGRPIPRSFFGLSTEYWSFAMLDRDPTSLVRVLDLLTVPGDGPLVLRIGGDSADSTLWRARPRPGVRDQFSLTPGWFAQLGAVTVAAHLRLLIDLNLVAHSPAMAAGLAHEAVNALPPESIVGFEIGNEPDVYHREPFYRLATLADVRPSSSRAWRHYSAASYATAFGSYARAVTATDGARIPLAGPEVANPAKDLDYLTQLLGADRPAVGLLTAHRYPYSACVLPSSPQWPTIARVLSPAASDGLAASVAPAVRLAAQARVPFRLTELNSVTCGGEPGVSNTFATALWAPDALFALLQAGVDGVNVHVRQDSFNGAFAMSADGLSPRPLLYGLLTFVRALGSGRTLVPVQVEAPQSLDLAVWAVRSADGGLHVVAIDKGPHPIRLTLKLPSVAPVSVQRLLAPSVRAANGVTLAGQTLDGAGQWVGHQTTQVLRPTRSGYELELGGYSAALVSVPN